MIKNCIEFFFYPHNKGIGQIIVCFDMTNLLKVCFDKPQASLLYQVCIFFEKTNFMQVCHCETSKFDLNLLQVYKVAMANLQQAFIFDVSNLLQV